MNFNNCFTGHKSDDSLIRVSKQNKRNGKGGIVVGADILTCSSWNHVAELLIVVAAGYWGLHKDGSRERGTQVISL